MEIAKNQISIVVLSQRYEYRQHLNDWLFDNNNVIGIPVIDMYYHDQSTRVVTGEWTLQFDQTADQTNMILQTVLSMTLIRERSNDFLESLPKIVDDYIVSLPANLKYRAIGLHFSFVIGGKESTFELNHLFSNALPKFKKLFGDQYEIAAKILWRHANFQAELVAMPVENVVGVQCETTFNYHRDIESAAGVKEALADFMSLNRKFRYSIATIDR